MAEMKPVVPIGTKVRAETAGWDDIEADSETGVEQMQEGPLEGWPVEDAGFFQYLVNGIVVDEASIEVVPAAK